MSKFKALSVSETWKSRLIDLKIDIVKFQKVGTKRIFWAPRTRDGIRINATMYAKRYDAISLAKWYIKYKEKEASLG